MNCFQKCESSNVLGPFHSLQAVPEQDQMYAKPRQNPSPQNVGGKYKSENGEEDIMLRDNNPLFQEKVEGKVLNHLQKKATREKLINWSIYNNGKQTIIVL